MNYFNSKYFINNIYVIQKVIQDSKDKMADFEFINDLNETESLLNIINNKYVLLDFWATWCLPCRNAVKDLVFLQEFYKSNLLILGVALERGQLSQKLQRLQRFLFNKSINYVNFIISDELKPKLKSCYYGIEYLTITILVNPEKEIIYKKEGGDNFLFEIKNTLDKHINNKK